MGYQRINKRKEINKKDLKKDAKRFDVGDFFLIRIVQDNKNIPIKMTNLSHRQGIKLNYKRRKNNK